MIRTCVAIIGFFLFTQMSSACGVTPKKPAPVVIHAPKLSVKAVVVGCNVRLEMVLVNNSDKTVLLDQGTLPWMDNLFGIRLKIYQGDEQQESMSQIIGIQHGDAEISLKPGESITGSFDVNGRFPDLVTRLPEANHFLRWQYSVRPLSDEVAIIESGVLLLPKCDPQATTAPGLSTGHRVSEPRRVYPCASRAGSETASFFSG